MRDYLIMAAVVLHYVLVGADAYAQLSIVPVVLSAPPASLAMYQGNYAYDPSMFWRVANLLALGFLVAALLVNWRTNRRTLLLTTLSASIVISVISLAYIFPAFRELVTSAYSDTVDAELVSRGATWSKVALTRLLVFGALGILPMIALTKHRKDGPGVD